MRIYSLDFKDNEKIPKKFTCEGKGINPNLIFESIPEDAKTLALILDDPDAPNQTFVHWILYNIPIVNGIKENSKLGIQGVNSLNKIGYVAPCPPSGTHRYFFKLYALDTKLTLNGNVTKMDLLDAMEGHILEKAELIGLYSKGI